jgi:hypothetical protein
MPGTMSPSHRIAIEPSPKRVRVMFSGKRITPRTLTLLRPASVPAGRRDTRMRGKCWRPRPGHGLPIRSQACWSAMRAWKVESSRTEVLSPAGPC